MIAALVAGFFLVFLMWILSQSTLAPLRFKQVTDVCILVYYIQLGVTLAYLAWKYLP